MFFSAVVCECLNYKADIYNRMLLAEKECCFVDIKGKGEIDIFVFADILSLSDLASSFSGKNDVEDQESREIFKEMINMIAGTALSYDSEGNNFTLGLPKIISYEGFKKMASLKKKTPDIIQAKMLTGELILVLFSDN